MLAARLAPLPRALTLVLRAADRGMLYDRVGKSGFFIYVCARYVCSSMYHRAPVCVTHHRHLPPSLTTNINVKGLAFLRGALQLGQQPDATGAKIAVNLAAKAGDARTLLVCLR